MAKIPKPKQIKAAATRHEAIETTSEVFSDGTALELIRLGSEPGETSLLWWDGKSATIGQQFEVDGKFYRAPQLHSTPLRAVRLPGGLAPYGSTRDLFNDIRQLATKYTDAAENYSRLIAYFILGDWLVERMLVAPFLFVIAPLSAARAQLLRLLSCLCRRPLILAEATPAAMSRFASLAPTFILDEPSLSRRSERHLYATNNRGRFAVRNGQIADLFSPKVICSQEPLRDTLLASQALQITLSPAGRQVPFLEDSACERLADEFQPKLLQYRLTNLVRFRTPDFDVSELSFPMQDVARAYAICVSDDEDLQVGIVHFLRDQEIYVDPSTELGSVILEGLLFCCHNDGRSKVLSGELADISNTIWAQRGEGRVTTPESVGWKLRELDLRTEPIDGAGKGLRLTESVRARIHSLAQAFGVPSLRHAAQESCPDCARAFGKQ